MYSRWAGSGSVGSRSADAGWAGSGSVGSRWADAGWADAGSADAGSAMRRIRRRTLLAMGLVTAAMGRTPEEAFIPPSGSLSFRLMRYGTPIGTHAVVFQNQPDGFDVHIGVNVLVKLGPIPFVRYTHSDSEAWRSGRLAAITAQTNRNGTELAMHAWRGKAGLQVEGSGTAPYVAPDNALPTTYWNPRMLDGPMIGTQDGMLVRPKVTATGVEHIRIADGSRIPARRYELSGDLEIVLFYDMAGLWAGMSFAVADGSIIQYERL